MMYYSELTTFTPSDKDEKEEFEDAVKLLDTSIDTLVSGGIHDIGVYAFYDIYKHEKKIDFNLEDFSFKTITYYSYKCRHKPTGNIDTYYSMFVPNGADFEKKAKELGNDYSRVGPRNYIISLFHGDSDFMLHWYIDDNEQPEKEFRIADWNPVYTFDPHRQTYSTDAKGFTFIYDSENSRVYLKDDPNIQFRLFSSEIKNWLIEQRPKG